MEALYETTDQKVFAYKRFVTFPSAWSTQNTQNRKAGAPEKEQNIFIKTSLNSQGQIAGDSTNLLHCAWSIFKEFVHFQ